MNLVGDEERNLFTDIEEPRKAVDPALDKIRGRFGKAAIQRARLMAEEEEQGEGEGHGAVDSTDSRQARRPPSSASMAAATIMFTALALVMICCGRLPMLLQREPGPSAGPFHEPP